jgi:hypothetical protein
LKTLRFYQDFAASDPIKLSVLQQWGLDDHASEPISGGLDIGDA